MERDANDMANELSDRIVEAGDVRNEIGHSHFQPEQGKVTGLQYVRQVNDRFDGVVVHLGRKQQTFAQSEIGVRKIGECLQQYQMRYVVVQFVGIELVQF